MFFFNLSIFGSTNITLITGVLILGTININQYNSIIQYKHSCNYIRGTIVLEMLAENLLKQPMVESVT